MSNCAVYAVQFVAAVAMAGDSRMTTRQAAAAIRCSQSYLEQIAYSLTRAGILHGIRGPGGGYILNRPASDITAHEILEAVGDAHRVISDPSQLESAWNRVSIETRFALSGVTVEDMIAQERRVAA